jgi:very-short-patch-repair endonuclease
MSRLSEHNKEVMASAEYRAGEMKTWPSPLEEKMKKYLDKHHIHYEEQKIFYIRGKDGYILKYYIADFYIPDKAIIIEVDGAFHDKHKIHDKMRTLAIQEQYPEVSVLRYRWKDLSNEDVMKKLLRRIG